MLPWLEKGVVAVLEKRHAWLVGKVFQGLQVDDNGGFEEIAEKVDLVIHENDACLTEAGMRKKSAERAARLASKRSAAAAAATAGASTTSGLPSQHAARKKKEKPKPGKGKGPRHGEANENAAATSVEVRRGAGGNKTVI